jgi:hypothetical protein
LAALIISVGRTAIAVHDQQQAAAG